MIDEASALRERLTMWKETYELSFELADTMYALLNNVIDYCEKHDVPIHKEKGTANLIRKAQSIFELIKRINSKNFKIPKVTSPFFGDRDPDKLPESSHLLYKKVIIDSHKLSH